MHRIVRWAGVIAGVLAAAALLLVGAVYALSARELGRRYAVAAEPPLGVQPNGALVERGRHLFHATATCSLCHSPDLGGAVYADAGPLGIIVGPNLTSGRGGIAGERTDAEWEHAIRHGVRPDGTSLIVMPSEVYANLTDEDLAAIIAYVRQVPPVDRELPRTHFRLLGRALLAAGRLPILVAPKTPAMPHAPRVTAGPTAEYGRYLADISGCHGCHGHGLSGGRVAGDPAAPPASNLTPAGIGDWTEAQFVIAMREGRRPSGTAIDEFMPWRVLGGMTDEELHALWLYLQRVPPKEFGNK